MAEQPVFPIQVQGAGPAKGTGGFDGQKVRKRTPAEDAELEERSKNKTFIDDYVIAYHGVEYWLHWKKAYYSFSEDVQKPWPESKPDPELIKALGSIPGGRMMEGMEKEPSKPQESRVFYVVTTILAVLAFLLCGFAVFLMVHYMGA